MKKVKRKVSGFAVGAVIVNFVSAILVVTASLLQFVIFGQEPSSDEIKFITLLIVIVAGIISSKTVVKVSGIIGSRHGASISDIIIIISGSIGVVYVILFLARTFGFVFEEELVVRLYIVEVVLMPTIYYIVKYYEWKARAENGHSM